MSKNDSVHGLSRRLSSSLSGKFVLLLVGVLGLIMIGGLVLFDVETERLGAEKITKFNKEIIMKFIYQEMKSKNQSEAQVIASKAAVLISKNDIEAIKNMMQYIPDETISFLKISDNQNKVLLYYVKNKITEAKIKTLETNRSDKSNQTGLSNKELSFRFDISIVTLPIMLNNQSVGTIQVGYETKTTDDLITYVNSQMGANFIDVVNSLQQWTIAFLIITLLLIVLIGIFIGKDIKNSLRKLLEGTEKISSGNLNYQLNLKSNDELEALANSFNDMTLKLKGRTVSKTYMDKIIQSIGNMLIVLDANFVIKSVNQATLKLLDYKEVDMIGKPFDFFAKEPSVIGNTRRRFTMEELRKNYILHNTESNYLKRNGDLLPVLFTSSVMYDEQNNLEAIICIAEDITEQKSTERKLNHLAHFDYLTNLPNRLLFEKTLNQMFSHAVRHKQKLAVLYLDLDDFKKVNDSLGHDYGDSLLVKIGERVLSCIREEDFLARLGGDEFGIILPDVGVPETAGVVSSKILSVVSNIFVINNSRINITASIGIATYPDSAKNTTTLVRNADVALYRAKHAGRNTYQYFSKQLYRKQQEIRKVEIALYSALQNNEMSIAFQPIFDLAAKKVIGAEALLRWSNPQLGEVPPDTFIPIAEAIGLIVPIGDWVLKNTFSKIEKWNNKGISTDFSIAINFSPVQLQTVDIFNRIKTAVEEFHIHPKQLTFEITETAVMKQVEEYEELFRELNTFSISIAIDDFGTGYSSLSHLKKLPIHKLKIDKSFVRDVMIDENDRIIVKSIISLGKNLGLEVIAEGVETEEQIEFLIQNGCNVGQGYYFSRAIPAEELEALLELKK